MNTIVMFGNTGQISKLRAYLSIHVLSFLNLCTPPHTHTHLFRYSQGPLRGAEVPDSELPVTTDAILEQLPPALRGKAEVCNYFSNSNKALHIWLLVLY